MYSLKKKCMWSLQIIQDYGYKVFAIDNSFKWRIVYDTIVGHASDFRTSIETFPLFLQIHTNASGRMPKSGRFTENFRQGFRINDIILSTGNIPSKFEPTLKRKKKLFKKLYPKITFILLEGFYFKIITLRFQ